MVNTHTVIVKVQVPLETSGERADRNVCLVYDKDKKNMTMQPISQKARAALRGDVQAFFEATFIDGTWNIYKRAPEQFW